MLYSDADDRLCDNKGGCFERRLTGKNRVPFRLQKSEDLAKPLNNILYTFICMVR